ncbi:hypothetical protein [Zoogloea sp.]|uniref:hypothetical protein n=1 Tax=Zoogloea sp. TaxID=49181 RepID=UPI001416E1BB|nr:MAG: hypothetical protein F9K15_02340 [Zoogloea sp.]
MDSYFKDYKPLRNYINKHNPYDALGVVWRMAKQFELAPANKKYEITLPNNTMISPWDLPLIVRETVLNGDPLSKRKLDQISFLTIVTGYIRSITGEADERSLEKNNVLVEMVKLFHRQFPRQGNIEIFRYLRYLKLYSANEITPYFEGKYGLTIKEFTRIAMALIAQAKASVDVSEIYGLHELGVPNDKARQFLEKLTIHIDHLKGKYEEGKAFDKNWEYAWNPLEAQPLIRIRDKILCPVPEMLFNRFGFGMYYDLCKLPGFDNAWGNTFEKYVGEVLETVFAGTLYVIHEENPYTVSGQRRDGVDWILEGPDGNVFIECKAKRMGQLSRDNADVEAISKEVQILADAVVQLYENVEYALSGKTNWKPNDLPSYLLVITLEDWYISTEPVLDMLEAAVREKLQQANLSLDLLEKWPYGIISAREFEDISSVVCEVGVKQFFLEKNTTKYRAYFWIQYAKENFPSNVRKNALQMMKKEILNIAR